MNIRPTGSSNDPRKGERASDSHEHFTELCALATTGTLTDSEWKTLKAHVAECSDCGRAIEEFRELARTAMPLVMADFSLPDQEDKQAWSPARAADELVGRIEKGHESGWQQPVLGMSDPGVHPMSWHGAGVSRVRKTFLLAAGLVLATGAAATLYRFLERANRSASQVSNVEGNHLQEEIRTLQQEKESLSVRLREKDAEISILSIQAERGRAEAAGLKAAQKETESTLDRKASELTEALTERDAAASARDLLARKLEEAETAVASLKLALDRVRQERSAELVQTASLETRIEELTTRLKHYQESNVSDAQLLASDRDIRELMGARELYVADVFDVAPDSSTQRPYGRIFYTRGKTLIFYAFDLDKQKGIRIVSSYQAWGRRGLHDARPLNMGIFYLDSDVNRRWILKFDNPEALAKIDTVFVTIEQKGGSQEPRGKPLLMASLKSQPNHP